MRTLRLRLRAWAASVCVALLLGNAALAATPASKAAVKANDLAAAKLVRAALEAELAGDTSQRAQRLHDALDVAPEYAPAHWHSAQLKLGEEWLPVEQLARRTRGDERMAAYRQKRDALVDTADNHRELARWCEKQQLHPQARLHWTKVLEFEDGDDAAIRALGLTLHDGRLMTRAQITQEQARSKELLRVQRFWQPRIESWRTALAGNNPEKRATTIEELREFREPLAVPLLVATFSKSDGKFSETHKLLIETLARIPDRAATDALLQLAVEPESEEYRIAAAEALGKHPPSTYMPQLIACLPPNESVETRHRYTVMGLTFFREHELVIRDLERGTSQSIILFDVDLPQNEPVDTRWLPIRLRRMSAEVAATDQQLAAKRAAIESERQRIELALKTASGDDESRSTQQWLERYDELNEAYTPAMSRVPEGMPTMRFELVTVRVTTRGGSSCFPVGTPILSADGNVGIETIRPGDLVVSQHPETGELALQCVQQVTLRPAAPLVEVGMGAESLLVTRGHPFWVNGKGWRMAKHLEVGDRLHTLHGAATIERLDERAAQEAYNLVVGEFGTYFVGEHAALVRDNQPLNETTVQVPGLAAATTP